MKSTDCYTMPLAPSGHFVKLSECNGTFTMVSENGLKLHGVKPSDLRTCGCGRWTWTKTQKASK